MRRSASAPTSSILAHLKDVGPLLQCLSQTDQSLLSSGYRRTALVIWPEGNSYYFVYRGQGLRYACHTLDKEDTPDVGLADWILSRAAKLPTLCVPAVCRAAIRWNDNALWGRAVKALFWYERRPLLDNEGLGQAFDAFGFEGVNQLYVILALQVLNRPKEIVM